MGPIGMVMGATLAVLLGGCVRDETRLMAATCENILAQESPSGIDAFLRDAEAKLEDLDAPPNRFAKLVRDVQDPDAMKHRHALAYCLARLKLHHQPRRLD